MWGTRVERVVTSARRDSTDLESLFEKAATKGVLQFIEDTEVGRFGSMTRSSTLR